MRGDGREILQLRIAALELRGEAPQLLLGRLPVADVGADAHQADDRAIRVAQRHFGRLNPQFAAVLLHARLLVVEDRLRPFRSPDRSSSSKALGVLRRNNSRRPSARWSCLPSSGRDISRCAMLSRMKRPSTSFTYTWSGIVSMMLSSRLCSAASASSARWRAATSRRMRTQATSRATKVKTLPATIVQRGGVADHARQLRALGEQGALLAIEVGEDLADLLRASARFRPWKKRQARRESLRAAGLDLGLLLGEVALDAGSAAGRASASAAGCRRCRS